MNLGQAIDGEAVCEGRMRAPALFRHGTSSAIATLIDPPAAPAVVDARKHELADRSTEAEDERELREIERAVELEATRTRRAASERARIAAAEKKIQQEAEAKAAKEAKRRDREEVKARAKAEAKAARARWRHLADKPAKLRKPPPKIEYTRKHSKRGEGRNAQILAALRGKPMQCKELFAATGGGNENSFSVALATLRRLGKVTAAGRAGSYFYSLTDPAA